LERPVIMDVTLRPFTNGDIGAWQRWRSAIDLDKFMSRSAPSRFDGTVDQWGSEYRWFVIKVGDLDAGAIWLEREPGEWGVVRLGIFLGNESSFGKGVGRRAIEQAVCQAHAAFEFTRVRLAVRLNNDRAIACYRACGFREVGRGTKADIRHDAVDFMTMEREA